MNNTLVASIGSAFDAWMVYILNISEQIIQSDEIAHEQNRLSNNTVATCREYENQIIDCASMSKEHHKDILDLHRKMTTTSQLLAYGPLTEFDQYHYNSPNGTALQDIFNMFLKLTDGKYNLSVGHWECNGCGSLRNGGRDCLWCGEPRY